MSMVPSQVLVSAYGYTAQYLDSGATPVVSTVPSKSAVAEASVFWEVNLLPPAEPGPKNTLRDSPVFHHTERSL